ncbi:MAG: antibiotic biosynthesis monooxygenase [Sediminimonas sp.]|uniref:antibiotic biosynthesis monooxygenase family protein n=1 Tax=Sediminimonas sp. TaxID=2823379 RepID=UPI0028702AF6|nr:antibiotic biosynthesis monooxygenase [Sediminimonas sp.]MDR9485918.1 antibiotic biosynthesis monooxygenase [Sediminimonas sp.]
MSERFAKAPNDHHYAVIFSSQLADDDDGYAEMGDKMFELALQQPGCFGAESARDETGFGITVSYWDSEESIARWKEDARHLVAQRMGIERWYTHYELRIARVERAYSGPRGRSVG